jgi:hypothetical protein
MNPLRQLLAHGQSYWLDNLTRQMIRSGELERRVRDEGQRHRTFRPCLGRTEKKSTMLRHLSLADRFLDIEAPAGAPPAEPGLG